MRLAIFWDQFLHYHVARVRALTHVGEANGHEVYPLALWASSAGLPLSGYHGSLQGQVEVLFDTAPDAGRHGSEMQRRLTSYLDRHNPEVVAIPGYDGRAALTALHWCRARDRGAVLMTESQLHDFKRSPFKEDLKRRLMASFDAALVGGTPHVAYARHLGFAPNVIFEGYDAVDNAYWAERARELRVDAPRRRADLGLPAQYFLTASRLVPKKNVSGLLRAYARYTELSTGATWSLVIAGDGPLRGELEVQAAELGLVDRVQFRGYLPADALAPIYALASAFVLASAYSEQWGLVVNEAMAAGLPVLVSSICGCAPDLVEDGVTGFTFDPLDEDYLARLLLRMSNGALDLAELGRQAQTRVARFSPEQFATSLWGAAALARQSAVRAHPAGATALPGLLARVQRR